MGRAVPARFGYPHSYGTVRCKRTAAPARAMLLSQKMCLLAKHAAQGGTAEATIFTGAKNGNLCGIHVFLRGVCGWWRSTILSATAAYPAVEAL